MKFLPWPASIRVSAGYYSGVVKALRQIADTYGSDRGNDPYDTLVGYEHFFANIGALTHHPGAGYVKDLFFKGRPAVVVATGPSLKKNVRLLKSIEDSAVIVSADASLGSCTSTTFSRTWSRPSRGRPASTPIIADCKTWTKTVFAARILCSSFHAGRV